MNDLRRILAAYPLHLADARWVALGNAGGFSGARIWRGTAFDGREFAFKEHSSVTSEIQLTRVHRWMKAARDRGLLFVPTVEPSRDGLTVATVDGRTWDVTTWMRGNADFHDSPSEEKLRAAITAIARIHQSWFEVGKAQCPAIERRHRVLREWQDLVRAGWRPGFANDDPISPYAEAAWHLLPEMIPRVLPILEHWIDRPVPVQPCMIDVWHDHILFDGDRVTGVIDFAAAKIDHVAADLARLLGSMIPDDRARTESALRHYIEVQPLPNPELVGILDRTGVVASIANWLRRLYHSNELIADRGAVARRLGQMIERLVRRVDSW